MSITPNYFHSSRNVEPLDLSYRPTVVELRKYLAHYGVTVPSRLRKDDLMTVALDVRFSDVETVERYVAKVGGTIGPVTVPAVEVDVPTTVPVNTPVTVERSDGPCPGWLMGTVIGTDQNGAVEVDYDSPISTDPGVRVLVECDDNCYSHVITTWSRVTLA